MKRAILSLSIILTILLTGCKEETDREILTDVLNKLNKLEHISYKSTLHNNMISYGIDIRDTVQCYLDFTDKENLIGTKYCFDNGVVEMVYNGSYQFLVIEPDKKIIINDSQREKRIYAPNLLQSPYGLRKQLPIILSDTSIVIERLQDTLIHNEKNYRFRINLVNCHFDLYSELKSSNGTSTQLLTVSQETRLPYSINRIYPNNDGFSKSIFTDYSFEKKQDTAIWHHARFPESYQRGTHKELYGKKSNMIAKGKKAPDFGLPTLAKDSLILSEQKGKAVLLEFQFPGCGPCVKAIPFINEMHEKYKEKGLLVYGVEIRDVPQEELEEYCKHLKIKYPMCHTGGKLAKDYGIHAAPTFVLIDQSSEVRCVYEGFEESISKEEIEKEIKAIL